MMKLGTRGEELAVKFLKKKGYRIKVCNYKTRIGEIDIIASDGETLVFVEVKTRESLEYGHPFEAVNARKRKKIANVALLYLKKFEDLPPCRFDIVSIFINEGEAECELIKDAFEV
jgi:putative endonuclease